MRVLCPLPAQIDAGRRRMDITLSPLANGPRGPLFYAGEQHIGGLVEVSSQHLVAAF